MGAWNHDLQTDVCEGAPANVPQRVGFATSTDSGNIWGQTQFFDQLQTNLPLGFQLLARYADPGTAMGGNGNLYLAVVNFTCRNVGPGAVLFTRSTNQGGNFDPMILIPGSDTDGITMFTDKSLINADPSTSALPSGCPRKDRVFVHWVDGGKDVPGPLFSRSCDGGVSFSDPKTLDTPLSGRTIQAPVSAVGPNGEVYVAWLDFNFLTSAVDDKIRVARSDDGDSPFSTPVTAAIFRRTDSDRPANRLPNTNFRTRSYPIIAVDPRDSTGKTVYVVYEGYENAAPDNDAEIFLVRSTDGGANWSAPIVVNDDATGHSQFFPWMAVNDFGEIGVMWYDRRDDVGQLDMINDHDGVANNEHHVYFAFSHDGGLTFSPNHRVTTAISVPGNLPMIGDYNGLAARGDTFFPLWTDLRDLSTMNSDIFTARIRTLNPKLIDVMGGIGAEFPEGKANTFISPLGDWLPGSGKNCDFVQFDITVTESVTLIGQEVVFTGDPADKPIVTSLIDQGNGVHTVVLDRRLVPQQWAKIILTVQSVATGCQGTLLMWVAHHPDNVNQDGVTNIMDATAFGNEFNGPKRHVLIDINCDGLVNISDATAFGNQWRGDGGATQAWANTSLPAKP